MIKTKLEIISNLLLKVGQVKDEMNKFKENVNVKNQFSIEIVIKDVNNENSVIPAYYKKKDAADYLDKTEAIVEGLTEMGLLNYGVLFPDGEPIYSIDDLDGIGILLMEHELMDPETDTTE